MRTKLIVAAVATAATVSAVGASAYTEGFTNAPSHQVVGYATTTIDGATMHAAPTFSYNGAHSTITAINVVLEGDTTGSTLSIDPNGTGPVACSPAGTYDVNTHLTTYACTENLSANGLQSLAYVLN